jgi:hypothetical protein
MIAKTMLEMERSYNLGTTPGIKRAAARAGTTTTPTRRSLIAARLRQESIRAAWADRRRREVFWPDEIHQQKRRDMGPYTYAAQILLNPKADAAQGFKRDWLRKYDRLVTRWTELVSPRRCGQLEEEGLRLHGDVGVGLGADDNYYCIPEVRDRLNLKERGDRLFDLHRTCSMRSRAWRSPR